MNEGQILAMIASATPALSELIMELLRGGMPADQVIPHIIDSARANAAFDGEMAKERARQFPKG